MKYFHPIYPALFICIALAACSGNNQEDADEEILGDKPTADQLYRDQGTIGQDMSPDTRDGDGETTEAGRMAEPRLIPDLSHVLSREAIAPPTGFVSANIYTGTLPCANCSGIETELTMLRTPLADTDGTSSSKRICPPEKATRLTGNPAHGMYSDSMMDGVCIV